MTLYEEILWKLNVIKALFLFGLTVIRTDATDHPCGIPGMSRNSKTSFLTSPKDVNIITTGTTVKYNCSADSLLFGNTFRTCGENGMWNGTIPVCVPKSPNCFLNASVTTSDNDETPEKFFRYSNVDCLSDGYDEMDCIRVPPGNNMKKVFIQLKDIYYISAMKLSLRLAINQLSISIFVINVDGSTECDFKTFDDIVCSTNNTQGNLLEIRIFAHRRWLFINELQIYEKPSRFLCKTSDKPAFGWYNRVKRLHLQFDYFCHKGYLLNGPSSTECLPNGTWPRFTTYCKESKCIFEKLSIANGEMRIQENEPDKLELKCNEGYVPEKESLKDECYDGKHWRISNATCIKSTRDDSNISKFLNKDTIIVAVAIFLGAMCIVLCVVVLVLVRRKRSRTVEISSREINTLSTTTDFREDESTNRYSMEPVNSFHKKESFSETHSSVLYEESHIYDEITSQDKSSERPKTQIYSDTVLPPKPSNSNTLISGPGKANPVFYANIHA